MFPHQNEFLFTYSQALFFQQNPELSLFCPKIAKLFAPKPQNILHVMKVFALSVFVFVRIPASKILENVQNPVSKNLVFVRNLPYKNLENVRNRACKNLVFVQIVVCCIFSRDLYAANCLICAETIKSAAAAADLQSNRNIMFSRVASQPRMNISNSRDCCSTRWNCNLQSRR